MAVVEYDHATEFDTQTRYLCTPDKRFVPCEGRRRQVSSQVLN